MVPANYPVTLISGLSFQCKTDTEIRIADQGLGCTARKDLVKSDLNTYHVMSRGNNNFQEGFLEYD